MNSITAKGIDVSRWQGSIDWKKVKAAGVEFAMIRLGSGDYNRNGAFALDTYFRGNLEQAAAAGLDVGVYFYSYARSVAEARKEGEFVRDVLANYPKMLTYPVAYDVEDSSQGSLGKVVLSGMVAAFAEVLESAGYYVSLYSFSNWLKTKFDAATLSRFDVWLAEWSAAPTYSGPYGMWQYAVLGTQGTKGKDYTQSGKVDGIGANVDVNYAYKNYPAIIKGNGLNGFPKPGSEEPAPKPKPEPEIDWSRKGLEMLVGAEIISDPDAWAGRMKEPITIGELFGILGQLHK